MGEHRIHNLDELVDQLATQRRALRIRQRDLAEQMGWGKLTLCQWETHRRGPSARGLIDWADALGYDVALIPRGDSTDAS